MRNLSKNSFLLLCMLSIFSCRKDQNQSSAEPNPITPDLSVKVSTSVSGYVTNESGQAVPFASVIAGDKQILTDKYGYFTIRNTSLAKDAGLVKIMSKGYFNGYQTILPQKDKESFVRIQLLSKTETGTVDAATGGDIIANGGAKITLPADGVVTASNGAAYTGKVHVSLRQIDPAAKATLQNGMPGDNRGIDDEGHLRALKSYGAMAVELTGDNGQLLQIAKDKTADIFIPISPALAASVPESVTLWSFNDSTGLWKQESKAVKKDGTLCGTTSHFSFWDGAEGVALVNVKAKIVNASSQPLVHVPVSVTQANLPQNAGYGTFGYTDADGNISGAVYANSNLVFQVLTPCAVAAYAHPFTTTTADVDLGQLTGNLGQSEVSITATVNNCKNQPVTSGYVQTYDHGFYNRIPVVNGHISFTGVLCNNQTVNVVAIDDATNQQGSPKLVTLAAGANDLGTLTACGTSTMGSISYTYDNVTKTITEPADTIGGYFLVTPDAAVTKWTQILTLSGNPNVTQRMSFQMSGDKTVGGSHTTFEVFSTAFPSGRGYWPVAIPVTITEFGEIGDFISGSFSSNFLDFSSNDLHTLSCTFRVRRYN